MDRMGIIGLAQQLGVAQPGVIGLAKQLGVAQPQANRAPNPTGLAQQLGVAQPQAQQAQASDSGISSLVPKAAPVDSNGRPMVFSEKYGWMPASGDGTVPGMMPQGGDFVPQTGTPGYTDGDRWNNQPPQQTVQPPSQSPLNRIYDERVQSPTDYPFMGGSPPISQPGNEVMDLNGRIAMASGPPSSTNYSQPQQMTPEQIFAILSENRNSNPFSRNRTSRSGMFDAMREALTSNVNPFRRG